MLVGPSETDRGQQKVNGAEIVERHSRKLRTKMNVRGKETTLEGLDPFKGNPQLR